MDSGLLDTIRKFKLTSYKRRCTDKDFVDRLNDFYTPVLLSIFTIIICAKSYIVGEPLQCWVPVHFSGGWEKYSESYCFIKNTYYFPYTDEIPTDRAARTNAELRYYQWVPFVLGLQAALFLLPTFFWKSTNWYGRLHLMPLIERAVMVSHVMGDDRNKSITNIAEHLHTSLFNYSNLPKRSKFRKVIKNRNKTCCGLVNSPKFLSFCYLITKVLLILNIIVQFVILKSFLQTKPWYGYSMVKSFANGSDWQQTGLFPRVTFCDITMLRLGEPIPYTLQCVLVINLFNEKIYMFIWFWLFMLLILTVINFFEWIIKIFGRCNITSLYSTKELNNNESLKMEMDNCEEDVTLDACFTLRLIRANCGILTTQAIIRCLLSFYKRPPIGTENNTKPLYQSMPPNYTDISKSNEIPLTDFV